MAYTQLETNYSNDILDTDANENVVYQLKHLDDPDPDATTENISLTDMTVYLNLGDSLDATVVNTTNNVVNTIGNDVTTNTTNIGTLLDGKINLNTSAASGIDHDLYAAIVALGWQSYVIV